MRNVETVVYVNKHACRLHAFWDNQNLKPPVARKLAIRHTSFVCLTASFLATGSFSSNSFTKFLDFSKIIKGFFFPNSMIFPCMELFW